MHTYKCVCAPVPAPTRSVPKKKFGQYSRQAFQNLYSCLLFSKSILSSIDGYIKAFLNGLKNNFRADEIVFQVEGLAARPADLSLVPRTHVSKVRTTLSSCPVTSTHVLWCLHCPP